MLCPQCARPTISFRLWCRSANAFRWTCPHCGAALKASAATWRWFAAALALVGAVVAAVVAMEHAGLIAQGGGGRYLFFAILAAVLPLCLLAYRHGGYELRQPRR